MLLLVRFESLNLSFCYFLIVIYSTNIELILIAANFFQSIFDLFFK